MRLRVKCVSRLVWSSRQGWSSSPEVELDLSARSCQQRANDGNAVDACSTGMNARQAARAGSAKELHQHGFGLVVGVVGGGDGVEAFSCCASSVSQR